MLEILQAAYQMTLQDQGRYGYQSYGVPVSGPMDWAAYLAANLLVANHDNETCIEIGLSDARFRISSNALVALTGVGYQFKINRKVMPCWTGIWVHAGAEITCEKKEGGNWAYLAVSGGINVPYVLGSRSTYLRAGLGIVLENGTRLPVKLPSGDLKLQAGRRLPEAKRPAYGNQLNVAALPGPHVDRLTPLALQAFWQEPYMITPLSDRIGLRLEGSVLKWTDSDDILSQGMVLGAVQVPPDGQPIVMMADHPTTGGYPQVAVVTRAALPFLAQAEPGIALLRFNRVELDQAQKHFIDLQGNIRSAINESEDEWLNL